MNCIGALRRCSLTFAALVRSCGSGLVVDCALIAHGTDRGKGIGRFTSLRRTRRLDHSECVHLYLLCALLSVGSTGRGQEPTSTQNNLGLLQGPNLSPGLFRLTPARA